MDLTYWINQAKANAAGKVPVSLRITIHGTRAECATGIRCLPGRWDKARKRLVPAGKRDPATADLNAALDNLEARARLLPSELRPLPGAASITAAQVRAALRPAPPAPVPCALALLAAVLAARPHPATAQNQGTALAAFRRFVAVPALPLPALTPALVADFAAATPQAARYLPRLSGLYSGLRLPGPNPFQMPAGIRPLAAPPRPRYVLSRDELGRLAALQLPAGPAAWARDMYLCQYYLHGSRLGPVLELDWQQVDWAGGRVRFRAEKGGGWHNVALRPQLAAVLRRYPVQPAGLVFPLLPADHALLDAAARFRHRKNATGKVWYGLRTCERLLGLGGRLHSHTARHTLATHTVEATGSIRAAQGLLGHKSEATTERYIRGLLPAQLDAVGDSVYGDDKAA